jgi:hypothetical protein
VHSWSTFGVRTNHTQTRIHKIHHGPDLGKATTFPLIVYFVPLHEAHIQMAFCFGTPKWESQNSQSWGLPQLWGPIALHVDLWLRWGWKQSCSPHGELSNIMSHATYMQRNRVDFWFLMVGSQITNLIPDLSFGHNLCFKCQNGSCELILDIYVSIAFQWYKKFFNSIGFDPFNCSLKIQESIGTPTPKVGVHLGMCEGSFPHTFLHSRGHEMWFSGFLLGPHLHKPLPWSRAQGQGCDINALSQDYEVMGDHSKDNFFLMHISLHSM